MSFEKGSDRQGKKGPMNRPCPVCNGTGKRKATQASSGATAMIKCRPCNGTGKISD